MARLLVSVCDTKDYNAIDKNNQTRLVVHALTKIKFDMFMAINKCIGLKTKTREAHFVCSLCPFACTKSVPNFSLTIKFEVGCKVKKSKTKQNNTCAA